MQRILKALGLTIGLSVIVVSVFLFGMYLGGHPFIFGGVMLTVLFVGIFFTFYNTIKS